VQFAQETVQPHAGDTRKKISDSYCHNFCYQRNKPFENRAAIYVPRILGMIFLLRYLMVWNVRGMVSLKIK